MPLTVWLTCESALVQKLIAGLQSISNEPHFIAHMTILGEISNVDVDSLRNALEGIIRDLDAIEPPEVSGLSASDAYFRTFFIRFKRTSQLNWIRSEISRLFHSEASVDWDPHVSLCYHDSGIKGVRELSKKDNFDDFLRVLESANISIPDFESLMEHDSGSFEVPCPDRLAQSLKFTRFDIMDCPLDNLERWRSVGSIDIQ